MTHLARTAIGLFFVLAAAAAHAAKPQIQWNPDYDWDSLDSFEWSAPNAASLASSDPFLHAHVVNSIEYQLTSHGITEVDSGADVRVTYHMSTETDIRLQSSSVGYGFGNYGRRGWGYYGYGMRGPVYTDTRVVEIERGTLMIDIWDAAANELIWRGKVDGIAVSGDPRKMQKRIDKAIRRMAKQADKLRRQNAS